MGDEEAISTKRGGMKPLLEGLRVLGDRVATLEGGHESTGDHETFITCPTCYAKTSPGDYPKHYDSHQKKQEPKVTYHKFAWGVGFCDNQGCQKIEARDLPKVMSHLGDIKEYLKKSVESDYECLNCHVPLPDARELKDCPWCGSTKALKRKH